MAITHDDFLQDIRGLADLFQSPTHDHITGPEMVRVLQTLGLNLTAADLTARVACVDVLGRGRLSLPEFLDLLVGLADPDHAPEDDLLRAFRYLSEDGGTTVGVQAIRDALRADVPGGDPLTDQELEKFATGLSLPMDLPVFLRVFLPVAVP